MSIRVRIGILMMAVLWIACSNDEASPQNIAIFKSYGFKVWSATTTTDGGFLINCANDVKKINSDGDVEWIYPLTGSTTGEKYFVSHSFSNDRGIFILSSHLSDRTNDSVAFSLQIHKLDINGQPVWTNEYPVATVYTKGQENPGYFIDKVNFHIFSNNYGLGAQDENGDLFAAVSYDMEKGEPTRWRLMKFTEQGSLVDERDFSLHDFQARVYALKIVDDELIVSSGDNAWFQLDAYDKDLEDVRSHRYETDPEGMVDPTFTNILETKSGHLVYTGHGDKFNSEPFDSNFDCLIADEPGMANNSKKGIGELNDRNLSFGSVLTNNGDIALLCNIRPGEGVTQDDQSGFQITFVNPETMEETASNVISVKHGLEGMFIHPLSDDQFVVIGTKSILGGGTYDTFFMKVRPGEFKKTE